MEPLPAPEESEDEGLGFGEADLAGWMAEVEGRLAAVDARLAGLESSIPAVADEVRAANADLRRAMSELRRRLVQDLPHELARHRDAIVAELRPPPPPSPLPSSPEPDLEPSAEPIETLGTETTDADDAPDRRVPRRRRRNG